MSYGRSLRLIQAATIGMRPRFQVQQQSKKCHVLQNCSIIKPTRSEEVSHFAKIHEDDDDDRLERSKEVPCFAKPMRSIEVSRFAPRSMTTLDILGRGMPMGRPGLKRAPKAWWARTCLGLEEGYS